MFFVYSFDCTNICVVVCLFVFFLCVLCENSRILSIPNIPSATRARFKLMNIHVNDREIALDQNWPFFRIEIIVFSHRFGCMPSLSPYRYRIILHRVPAYTCTPNSAWPQIQIQPHTIILRARSLARSQHACKCERAREVCV